MSQRWDQTKPVTPYQGPAETGCPSTGTRRNKPSEQFRTRQRPYVQRLHYLAPRVQGRHGAPILIPIVPTTPRRGRHFLRALIFSRGPLLGNGTGRAAAHPNKIHRAALLRKAPTAKKAEHRPRKGALCPRRRPINNMPRRHHMTRVVVHDLHWADGTTASAMQYNRSPRERTHEPLRRRKMQIPRPAKCLGRWKQ